MILFLLKNFKYNLLSMADSGLIIPWKYLLYGAISGGISRSAIAPLEYLRLQLQVNTSRMSVWEIISTTHNIDGYRGFFKGNLVNTLRVVPTNAARFFVYNTMDSNFNKGKNTLASFICGATAGMISAAITYPLDLIRSHLTTVKPGEKKYTSITSGFSHIVKTEGIYGLYKGLSASMFGISLYVGINMTVFGKIKDSFGKKRESHFATGIQGMVIGFFSGTTAICVGYPVDVIRRHIMMDGLDGTRSKFKSTPHAIQYIFAKNGIRAFYWGFTPTLLKVIPSTMINWGIMELCREIGGTE